MTYMPPFKITPYILKLIQEIAKDLGIIAGRHMVDVPFELRRENRIKGIQASLAIEGNTLSLNQVTDILDGKRVLGPQKDILEVKNALAVYAHIDGLDPVSEDDLLKAHGLLMQGLASESGRWRSGAVGIFKGSEVSHVAPPAKNVPYLMQDLFEFLGKNQEVSWLIKACIFHYELEFIHPFMDGNGRIGRLWQQLILMKEDPLFQYLPFEVLIKMNQQEYYDVLGECDRQGESTLFIEFSLKIIRESLSSYVKEVPVLPQDATSRLYYAQKNITEIWFSRKDYQQIHKTISTATASRDLLFGVDQGILAKQGDKNQVRYKFVDNQST